MQDRCSHFRRRIVSVAERSVHQASSNDQITASQRGEKSCKAVFCPGNYLTELLRAKMSVLCCVWANILISVCVLPAGGLLVTNSSCSSKMYLEKRNVFKGNKHAWVNCREIEYKISWILRVWAPAGNCWNYLFPFDSKVNRIYETLHTPHTWWKFDPHVWTLVHVCKIKCCGVHDLNPTGSQTFWMWCSFF